MADISQECRAEVAQRQLDALSAKEAERAKMGTLAKLFASSTADAANVKAFSELRIDAATGGSKCNESEIASVTVFTNVANQENKGKGRR